MHDHKAYHQSEKVHDGLVVKYPILGYTLHVPPSNFCPPSHASLLHAVLHWCQHKPAPLRQLKLSKDTVQVVCLYYAKTHKWHDYPPHIPPCNAEGRKVA